MLNTAVQVAPKLFAPLPLKPRVVVSYSCLLLMNMSSSESHLRHMNSQFRWDENLSLLMSKSRFADSPGSMVLHT